MMLNKLLSRSALPLLLGLGTVVQAATPATGSLTEDAKLLQWDGDGPYVLPNVTPVAGDPVPVFCQPGVPQVCDQFVFDVSLSAEFRELPENQRETTKVAISFPAATGQEDYDLYLYDAAGTLVASSATGGQEAVTIPLKSLKDGSYTVTVIPFLPAGTNYTGLVQVGKDAPKAIATGFNLFPAAGSAPLTVTLDARALARTAPAGGYVFDFGDGSLPVTDADGVVEHTYQKNGQFLSRVRFEDSGNPRGTSAASQTVFVGDALALADKGAGNRMGGAFGAAALFGLLALAGLRRTRRA